jgi:hypothetical protein
LAVKIDQQEDLLMLAVIMVAELVEVPQVALLLMAPLVVQA